MLLHLKVLMVGDARNEAILYAFGRFGSHLPEKRPISLSLKVGTGNRHAELGGVSFHRFWNALLFPWHGGLVAHSPMQHVIHRVLRTNHATTGKGDGSRVGGAFRDYLLGRWKTRKHP